MVSFAEQAGPTGDVVGPPGYGMFGGNGIHMCVRYRRWWRGDDIPAYEGGDRRSIDRRVSEDGMHLSCRERATFYCGTLIQSHLFILSCVKTYV